MSKLRALKLRFFMFPLVLMLSFSFPSYASHGVNDGLVDVSGQATSLTDYVIAILQSINYHLTSYDSGTNAKIVYTSGSGSNAFVAYSPMMSLQVPVASFNSTSQQYIINNMTYSGTFLYCVSNLIAQIPRNLNFYTNKFLSSLVYPFTVSGFLNTNYIDLNVITYVVGAETFTVSQYQGDTDFISITALQLSNISVLLQYYASRFYEWFYPLDNVSPEYWRYYNTDTGQSENIGLAGLMYNISWYLGQLYVLQSANAALQNMADAVSDAADTFTAVETQEHTVISSVSSAIENFNPDISFLGSLTAIAWVSNYLQQCFVSIGAFGIVIMLGLLLGVCMQFIGYFKYK